MTTDPMTEAVEAAARDAAIVICALADSKYHEERTDDFPCAACQVVAEAAVSVATPILRAQFAEEGVTIRELERLNTELNDELGTAVQVLKLERDKLRARLAGYEWADELVQASCTAGHEIWINDGDGGEYACPSCRLAAIEAMVREWEIAVGPAPYTIRKKLRAALGEGGEQCLTCQGPTRETVGLVCQTCGRDYGPEGGIDLTDGEFAAFLKAAKG